jgi:hypothetical protein
MKSQTRKPPMRIPPMRQPTAAPAIALVLDCGPGVGAEVALAVELENVDCEGAEDPVELGNGSDVGLLKVVVWGSWIAGIVVRESNSKVVVPMIEVMVFVGVRGATVADRVIVESRGISLSTVAVTK